ncbi:hypothetical protein RvY_11896-1 [Ramazzottius varieornatus]|uniref:Uncharacterized protein n=1 Tax=Ramazzottius varieornatus TaxID=947166 RepID=A0A1D1VHP9_RAMVA|nr:hypothetical protein RvY_11896-1 [Ramazzottius varieornatus]
MSLTSKVRKAACVLEMFEQSSAERSFLRILGYIQIVLGVSILALLERKTGEFAIKGHCMHFSPMCVITAALCVTDCGIFGGIDILNSGLWTGFACAGVGIQTQHACRFSFSSLPAVRALRVCEYGNILATALASGTILGFFSPPRGIATMATYVCAISVSFAATLYASNLQSAFSRNAPRCLSIHTSTTAPRSGTGTANPIP